MRKFMMSLTTVASLSLAAVPILGLTQAANATEASISVGDLTLTNPADAATFKARVDSAARQVCRSPEFRGTPRTACMRLVRLEASQKLTKHQRSALQIAAQTARNTKSVELAAQ